jgi:hypothetical protein
MSGPRTRLLLIVSVVLALVAFVGLFRPSVLIGVSGDALAQSLERKAGPEFDNCQDQGG